MQEVRAGHGCSSVIVDCSAISATRAPLEPRRPPPLPGPGPLELPGWPGRHWYVVPRVGFPDPDTFHAAYAAGAAAERNKCRYPDCVDNGPEGKCMRWLVGECEGPKIGGQP